jgi:hypothetical protein
MDPEKVELCSNAASYSIEIDVQDLKLGESLDSRCERYATTGNRSENRGKNDQNVLTANPKEGVLPPHLT